ncbi:hypothetical protein JNUCC0626_41540 [Lentzea sp. JNUCC 0626]|uniref:hypothetical protein n=1 Tax=Lentzea sp. JNUCC 0626 TaxID=3367513 RepID=UPI0037495B2C
MRRLAVVVMAGLLAGCGPEEPDLWANTLVSCSVPVPQQWRDSLKANEIAKGEKNAVFVMAASDDGRSAVVQTWSSELELSLHTPDGQLRSILKHPHAMTVVGFDGRLVRFATQVPGEEGVFYNWDAESEAPPVRVAGAYPDRNFHWASDGITSVWGEGQRLFAIRPGWPRPRMIAEVRWEPDPYLFSTLDVRGDFVRWTYSEASYITDIRTGSTVHFGKGYVLEVIGGALVRRGPDVAAAVPLTGIPPLPQC